MEEREQIKIILRIIIVLTKLFKFKKIRRNSSDENTRSLHLRKTKKKKEIKEKEILNLFFER